MPATARSRKRSASWAAASAPLTYPGMVDAIKAKHPEANTSVKTVQWYASRLRREGETVNVKDGRTSDTRRAA